ncbi:MAG TPA: DUF6807 family protein, partial [Verrucomicrobiae bacterium]|nr:DUF6807 family protein [Verrucomicrobiae bacterium]
MQFIRLYLVLALALSAGGTLRAAGRPYSIVIHAGAYDRHQTPVFFKIPPEAGTQYSLRDDQGKIIPAQVDAKGNGCFIQNSLRRGDSKRYLFVAPQLGSGSERLVDLVPQVGGAVEITVGGRPVFRYHSQKTKPPRDGIKPIFARGGYLHPIVTPRGKTVTDDYATNHLHHHGVWFAWTKAQFDGRATDFWNMGDGKGTVE